MLNKLASVAPIANDILNAAGGVALSHTMATPKERKKNPYATLVGGGVGGLAGGRAASGVAESLMQGIKLPANNQKRQLVVALKELVSALSGIAGSAAGGKLGGMAGREIANKVNEKPKGRKPMKKQADDEGSGTAGSILAGLGGATLGIPLGGVAGRGVLHARELIRKALGSPGLSRTLHKAEDRLQIPLRPKSYHVTSEFGESEKAHQAIGSIAGGLGGAVMGSRSVKPKKNNEEKSEKKENGPAKEPEKTDSGEGAEKKAAFNFGIDTFCKRHGVDKTALMKVATGLQEVDENKFVEALYGWHQDLLKD